MRLPPVQTTLYGLLDPDSLELRYIGKSSTPKKRYVAHLNSARRGKGARCGNWIRSLLKLGKRPVMEVFQTVQGGGDELEIAAIGIGRALGCRLTNHAAGGQGQARPRNTYWELHWERVHQGLDKWRDPAQLRRLELLKSNQARGKQW